MANPIRTIWAVFKFMGRIGVILSSSSESFDENRIQAAISSSNRWNGKFSKTSNSLAFKA